MSEPVSLRDRIGDEGSAIDDIAGYLDGLGHEQRLAETRSLGRGDQRRLDQKAARARARTPCSGVLVGRPPCGNAQRTGGAGPGGAFGRGS